MKKIYVVTSGEYSDYCINAVFESREKAELYCAIKNATKEYRYDRCEIEEYELSDDTIEGNIDKWYYFDVRTYQHGGSSAELHYSIDDSFVTTEKLETKIEDAWHTTILIHVCIKENDPDKAIKIARDLVAKYEAEKAGL